MDSGSIVTFLGEFQDHRRRRRTSATVGPRAALRAKEDSLQRFTMLVLMACWALGCGGGEAEPAAPGTQATSGSNAPASAGVGRDEFLAALRPLTPEYFCGDQMYFRQCFAVSAEDCQMLSLVAYDACVRELYTSIPPVLSTEEEGAAVGEMIGTCAGEAYEIGLAENGLRYDNAICNDPANWTQNEAGVTERLASR
jgi:hypothetical protein